MIQISSSKYMPEFGIEDTCLFNDNEYSMDSFAFNFDDISYFNSFSAPTPESNNSSHNINNHNNKRFHSEGTQNSSFPVESPDQSVASATPPTKLQLKASSSSKIISFDNIDKKVKKPKTDGENLNFGGDYDKQDNKVAATITNRNPIQARDHVIAERKRRQKLNQKFITLSSILPGLKKMDKVTILGDAINHLKQLKERVESLEEQVADRKAESAVFVKRSFLFADDDSSSSSDENSDQSLPKIEAIVSGKKCSSESTVTNKVAESRPQYLTNSKNTISPFRLNKEYFLSIEDLIRSINQALKQHI